MSKYLKILFVCMSVDIIIAFCLWALRIPHESLFSGLVFITMMILFGLILVELDEIELDEITKKRHCC